MPELVCEVLADHHRISDFDCGKDSLTSWLRHHALIAGQQHAARTFVLLSGADRPTVVGYYSLSAHAISSDSAPRRAQASSLAQLPAVLVGKLALSVDVPRRSGLGTALLNDALQRIAKANEQVAARLVVVDPLDEDADRFYRSIGFKPLASESTRLYRSMKDVLLALP